MCQVLSTQELMYQNSNVYCWQTMIKTGCLVLFRLTQSCAFYVKLESSCCRIKCAFRPGSIDRSLDWIDRISGIMFFLQIFPTRPWPIKTCRVLCFALSIKGKTLATFFKKTFQREKRVSLLYLGFCTQTSIRSLLLILQFV